MKPRLLIAGTALAAVAGIAAPASGSVSAGVCSELRAAEAYHDWVGDMWITDPAFTENNAQNREYEAQLEKWLEIYNCGAPGAQ